jgi:serine/threonine protein kinase
MADLSPGYMLGQYRLGELIGRGGMASVYRARQESMDRDVAIKIMSPELSRNAEFAARFEREARVIAKLQHPHILPVIDFGRSEYVYLVMRLVSGGSLSERLRQTTLTLRQVNQFLGQIASALEYAHQRGVVHRDLKPDNVLLDEQDNAYLTDFGIAKMLAGTTTSASLTSTGTVMGTPAYMAPEQWRSEPVDARTDIYALGIILYEMLMGTLPFQSETPFGMMYKHFDSPPPPPSAINPVLPGQVEQIVLRALAKNPDDRYPSAREMADEFNRVVQAMPPEVAAQKLPRATLEQIERATPPAQRVPTPPQGTTAATRYDDTLPPSGSRSATPTLARAAAPPARRSSGRGLIVAGALAVVVIAAVVIGVIALSGGENSGDGPGIAPGDAASHTAQAVAVVASPAGSDTLDTRPVEPGLATPTALPTATVTPSDTLSPSPSATFTPSNTPDLDATAEVLLAERLTQTAASWTDTPTPDIEASVVAALTGTAMAWTATPAATATFTSTPTATFTDTPSPTDTPIPTATLPPPTRTPLPTLPPLPTRTTPPTRTTVPTQVSSPTPWPTPTSWPTPTLAQCSALPSRIFTEMGARTTLLPAVPTSVRQSPGLSSPILRSIQPGQTFWVLAGPQCANNILWWQIEGTDASGRWAGWIGEGQVSTYWIEPFSTGPVDCPGAPPPRLIPGQTGRITLDPPLPNRVRAQPSTADKNIVGQLQSGETFEVISGPVCDMTSHYRFWMVKGQTVEGWSAEGQLKPDGTAEYWMEPWH